MGRAIFLSQSRPLAKTILDAPEGPATEGGQTSRDGKGEPEPPLFYLPAIMAAMSS
jgi:hypothetical protein